MEKIIQSTFLLFASFYISVTSTFAQDVIMLKNGDEIESIVQEVGTDYVKYKKYHNQAGPVYNTAISEIFMIKYVNGSKDVFNETANPGMSAPVYTNEAQAPQDNYYVDNMSSGNTPPMNERHTEYQDGIPYQYYVNNGLTVSLTNTKNNDYGKWFKADIVIQNNTMGTIDFDPASSITAYSIDKNNKQSNLEVWSYERYMKNVHSFQVMNAVLEGLAGGLAVASAGYSTSTTTTNTHYNGAHNTRSNVPVRGNYAPNHGGYAPGAYPRNSSSGFVQTTRTTTTYNAGAAYQASLVAQNNMAALSNSQWNISNAIQMGYLKRNTIYPGQSIAGYVLIQRKSGKSVYITVNINGGSYEYGWDY